MKSLAACVLAAFVLVACTSRARPVCADDKEKKEKDDGSTALTAQQIENARAVIRLLSDKAATEPPDKADLKAALEAAAADLGQLLDDEKGSKIRSGGMRAGKPGQTNGEGDTPATKNVRIRGDLLNAKPCDEDFAMLADVLFHEGVHIRQMFKKPPEPPPFKPEPFSGPKMKKVPDWLVWKKDRIEQEIAAWNMDLKFKNQMNSVLSDILARIDEGKTGDDRFGEVAWAKNAWGGCSDEKLQKLAIAVAGKEGPPPKIGVLQKKNNALEALRKLKTEIEKMKGAGKTELEIVTYIDKTATAKDYLFSPARVDFQIIASGEPNPFIVLGEGVVAIDTGIPHIQDAALLTDKLGNQHLLVCGFTSPTGGTGIVKTVPIRQVKIIEEPIPGMKDEKGISFEVGTISCCASNLPWFTHPTSVTQAPDGVCYVFDADGPAFYRLPDDNADGLPDRIDPRNLINPPPGLGLQEWVEVHWMGEQPVAELRVGDTVGGAAPRFYFHDRDKDGVFEAIVPDR